MDDVDDKNIEKLQEIGHAIKDSDKANEETAYYRQANGKPDTEIKARIEKFIEDCLIPLGPRSRLTREDYDVVPQ